MILRPLPLFLALGGCLSSPPSSTGDGGSPPDDAGPEGERISCEEPADCPDSGGEPVCHCGSCAVPDPACDPSQLRWLRDDGKEGGCAPAPVDLSLGYHSSCVLWSDGRVSCWGGDCSGQVGDGGEIDCADGLQFSPVPRLVRASTGGPPFEGVMAVSAGFQHACALRIDGSVWCWGSNVLGKLGDASAEVRASTPVQVVTEARDPLSGIVAIAAGNDHTCALDGDGFVYCWGDNRYRQLGVTGVSERDVAILSGIGTDFVEIAAGGWHSCVSRRVGPGDPGLFCWGRGSFGQLGDDIVHEPGSAAAVPVVYEDDTGVELLPTVFGLGENSSCSATAGPGAWCWGSNLGWALGDLPAPTTLSGTDATSARQWALTLASAPTDIVGGTSFACMRLADRTLYCWGANTVGQVGLGEATEIPRGPSEIPLNTEDIDAGDDHACAITPERAVLCWGGNMEGQLGNGTTTSTADPTEVISLCQ